MSRWLVLVFGVVTYVAFLGVFVYLVAFVADLPIAGLAEKTVSHGGQAASGVGAVLANVAWLSLFGLQHSLMARAGFKAWIAAAVPHHVERSVYVLASSVVLALAMWQWRPLEGMVWQVQSGLGQALLWGVFVAGWLLIFVSTFLTDHFDLFGLRQVYLHWAGKTYSSVAFKTVLLYKLLRHPMMLGLLLAFWSHPTMTVSHLLFAAVMSVYVFVGIHFEERGLLRALGPDYAAWRGKTSMVLPF